MHISRIQVLMLAVVLAFTLLACGASPENQAIKLNAEFVALTEAYVAELDEAGDAKSVAKAMNNYADGLERVMPKMRELSEKHPELKDQTKYSDELKAAQKESEAVAQKMVGTFMKTMQHSRDPEVKAAQERIGNAMKG